MSRAESDKPEPKDVDIDAHEEIAGQLAKKLNSNSSDEDITIGC